MKTGETHLDLVPIHKDVRLDGVGSYDYTSARQDRWTPAKYLIAIQTMVKKAEAAGLTDMRIEYHYNDGDGDNLSSMYVGLVGTRLETQAEFIDRLEHNLRRYKADEAKYLSDKKVQESEHRVKSVQKLTDTIEEAKNALKKSKRKARVNELTTQLEKLKDVQA